MVVATLPLLWRLPIYLLAGIGAGIANGIAGGGTFVTFPTLLAMGVAPLTANVTTTVGVVPSYLGGIRGFRPQLQDHRALIRSLVPYSLVGTATDARSSSWDRETLSTRRPVVNRRGDLIICVRPAHHEATGPYRPRPSRPALGPQRRYLSHRDVRRLLRCRYGHPALGGSWPCHCPLRLANSRDCAACCR